MADLPHQLGEEFFLGREIGVEGAHGEVGGVGDLVDVRFDESAVPEKPLPRLKEAIAGVFGAGGRVGALHGGEDPPEVGLQAGKEPLLEDADHRFRDDRHMQQPAPDRAEADASEGEDRILGADLLAEDGGKPFPVEVLERSLVFDEAVLTFAEHGDEVGMVEAEIHDDRGEAGQLLGRGPFADSGDRLGYARLGRAEDPLAELFLAAEVAVENAV